MTTTFPKRGSNPDNRFQPFCLEQPHQQSKSHIKTIGPFILITLIVGWIILLPQGQRMLSPESEPPKGMIEITNDNELATIANSGVGSANDPYIIAGWNIKGSTTHGIFITGTTKHFRIENCSVYACERGIVVESVASGTVTITNNTCKRNEEAGIEIDDSRSSNITNNTCNSNDVGISLEDSGSSTLSGNSIHANGFDGISLWNSENSTISGNFITNNGFFYYFGLQAGISLWNSGSSTLSNNTVSQNGEVGIDLEDSGFSTVANNTCNNNGGGGIRLEHSFRGSSDNNSIVWNTLARNGAYGIALSEESANNVILHNNFITNGQNTSQACDNGTNNQWYDETVLEGNHWSDYTGTGNYSIAGSAGAMDPYPLLSPLPIPTSSPYTIIPDPKEIDPIDVSLLTRIGLFLFIIGIGLLWTLLNKKYGLK
ncbi:MAG: nitrous oxide reductase family maturation protein NosD [Candidatus Hermodarchaeota archaeon]